MSFDACEQACTHHQGNNCVSFYYDHNKDCDLYSSNRQGISDVATAEYINCYNPTEAERQEKEKMMADLQRQIDEMKQKGKDLNKVNNFLIGGAGYQ
jgi:hypothetical protein